MRCPFCSSEMRLGSIGIRAFRPFRYFEAAIEWQSDPPQRRRSWRNLLFENRDVHVRMVLPSTLLGRSRRVASYCDGCGAVLAHPTGAASPPTDAPVDAPAE